MKYARVLTAPMSSAETSVQVRVMGILKIQIVCLRDFARCYHCQVLIRTMGLIPVVYLHKSKRVSSSWGSRLFPTVDHGVLVMGAVTRGT